MVLLHAKVLMINNLSPVDIKKEFEFGTREIYAAISVSGLANGGNFRFIWEYADSNASYF